MNFINEILKKENPSIEDLISCFEVVRKNGDIAMIKFDGERIEDQYTVFISFPPIKKREMIRSDENNLTIALLKVLKEY